MKKAFRVFEDNETLAYFSAKGDTNQYIKTYKEQSSKAKIEFEIIEICEELKEHKDVKGVLMVSGMAKLTQNEKWALGLIK